MQKNNIILTALILLIVGTGYFTWRQYQYDPPFIPELNTALVVAGKNRPELEKLLEHYRLNEVDSLKLKVAIFLIENMSIHY
jgi:hypothetical protein